VSGADEDVRKLADTVPDPEGSEWFSLAAAALALSR